MMQSFGYQLAASGLKMDDYFKYMGTDREKMEAMYRPDAQQRVKTELVIEAIRKAEAIEPKEEDIEKQIAEQAERYGQDLEDFRKGLTEQQKEYLKDDAAISLVLDLLMKDAVIREKKPEAPTETAEEEKKEAEE